MAKTGVFDSDPTAIAEAKELKREMRKLLIKIEDEDDLGVQTIDQLQDTLSALREATMRKMAKSSSLEMLETVSCPVEFRCPLSNELMRDPVVLASGQVKQNVALALTSIFLPALPSVLGFVPLWLTVLLHGLNDPSWSWKQDISHLINKLSSQDPISSSSNSLSSAEPSH